MKKKFLKIILSIFTILVLGLFLFFIVNFIQKQKTKVPVKQTEIGEVSLVDDLISNGLEKYVNKTKIKILGVLDIKGDFCPIPEGCSPDLIFSSDLKSSLPIIFTNQTQKPDFMNQDIRRIVIAEGKLKKSQNLLDTLKYILYRVKNITYFEISGIQIYATYSEDGFVRNENNKVYFSKCTSRVTNFDGFIIKNGQIFFRIKDKDCGLEWLVNPENNLIVEEINRGYRAHSLKRRSDRMAKMKIKEKIWP